MKIKITILILFIYLFSHGQTSSTITKRERPSFEKIILDEFYKVVNSENHSNYLDKVKRLISYHQIDSSYIATKVMWALWFYDSLKYPINNFQPLLVEIQKSNENYYYKNLNGVWRFSHDSWTGFVAKTTTTTSYDTGRTISFKNGYAEFYFYDTLKRVTKFKVVPQLTGFELSRVNNFKILFEDTNELWTFIFSTKNSLNGDRISLTIILEPNCSCGCGRDIYFKQETPYLITKNNERTTRGFVQVGLDGIRHQHL